MCNPIPVTERLPEPDEPHMGTRTAVLAYDTEIGWVGAVYRSNGMWELEAAGISGYEWEAVDLSNVTHWMPYPQEPS